MASFYGHLKNYEARDFNTGFAIFDDVYSDEEIDELLSAISQADTASRTFRKSNDLFAIRQFFKEIPWTQSLVFNKKLTKIISELFGDDFFIVKSIYFDKPEKSNWFVSYHQDLTISVDKKIDHEGFARERTHSPGAHARRDLLYRSPRP